MAEKVDAGDTGAAQELAEALGQISETVTVAGKSIVIAPFKLRQFADVLKCVQRLRDAGAVETKTLTTLAKSATVEEAKNKFDVLKMFLAGGDEVINILQIASGLPWQILNALEIPDAVRLASAVLSVNLDFFFQNRELIQKALAPAVQAVEKIASEGVGGLGQPPLTDSSAKATD
jgi:hypothetical protein